MRKFTLLVAVLLAAGASTSALAAKKKGKAMAAPKMSAQDQSGMFMRDAMMPWQTKWAAPAETGKKARRMAKKKS